MAKILTPLTNTVVANVLTQSKLEVPKTVGDQEFCENYQQGRYHPISQDDTGKGGISMKPTFYDRRSGMSCSFLAKETK